MRALGILVLSTPVALVCGTIVGVSAGFVPGLMAYMFFGSATTYVISELTS